MENAGDAAQSVCLSVEGLMLRISKRDPARRHLRTKKSIFPSRLGLHPKWVPRYPELRFESLLGWNSILLWRLARGNRVIFAEFRDLPAAKLVESLVSATFASSTDFCLATPNRSRQSTVR